MVNNTYKQEKLKRVMLNEDGNENGIKFNRSNQQKNKFARVARFLSFFAVVLHNYNAVLFD